MNLKDLLKNPLKLYTDESGRPYSLQLSEEVLYFIDKNIGENSKTLETGAGISTVLFALKGAEHTCITPDRKETDRIKEYCLQNGISTDSVDFVVGRSEDTLPRTNLNGLDLAVIDGRHAFPTPFIDWYYISPFLKTGGMLILDDMEVWTVKALEEFLLQEPEWRCVKKFVKTTCFIKLSEGSHQKEWNEQSYVALRSRTTKFKLNYILYKNIKLLRQGKILQLIGKIKNLKASNNDKRK